MRIKKTFLATLFLLFILVLLEYQTLELQTKLAGLIANSTTHSKELMQLRKDLDFFRKVYESNSAVQKPYEPNYVKKDVGFETQKLNHNSEIDLTHKSDDFDRESYKIKLVSIRGERHSGTGWLRQMLSENCPHLQWKIKRGNKYIDADGKYGWKHAILNEPIESDDLMIFVFRNIGTWIPRMRLNTYEKQPKNHLTMARFLNEAWEPNLTFDTRNWKNIFEMRNVKYASWIEYLEKYPNNTVGVKYEDLIDDSPSFFHQLINKYGVPCYDNFKQRDCYSKHGKCVKTKKFELKNGRSKASKISVDKQFKESSWKWKKSDWKTVLKNIDIELEAKIGYQYK